jgi:hypothetical protein
MLTTTQPAAASAPEVPIKWLKQVRAGVEPEGDRFDESIEVPAERPIILFRRYGGS